jgi:hypothetical protein
VEEFEVAIGVQLRAYDTKRKRNQYGQKDHLQVIYKPLSQGAGICVGFAQGVHGRAKAPPCGFVIL